MAPRPKTAERDEILRDTRAKLMQAASEEFAREGYRGANVNRISTQAGFAKGTIYNYFDSKRGLMRELLQEIAQDHFNFVEQEVRRGSDPEGRIERFFQAGFRWAEDNLERGQVMLSVLYGTDLEFKRHLAECYRPFFQLLSQEIVGPGMEQGSFRKAEPQEIVALLMTIYLGTSTQFDDTGRLWLDPKSVSDFVLRAMRADDTSRN